MQNMAANRGADMEADLGAEPLPVQMLTWTSFLPQSAVTTASGEY